MEKQYLKEARDFAFHLRNLAVDFERDGMEQTAEDLRVAASTISALVSHVEYLGRKE